MTPPPPQHPDALRPVSRQGGHSLPHRVRLHRSYVLVMAVLLSLPVIGVGVIVMQSGQMHPVNLLVMVLSLLFLTGLCTLAALSQTYTLTPDALVRFMPGPGRTLRYADLVHAEVHQVQGSLVLALQQREGREVKLSVAMLDPGELLFTLNTLAERAPAIVLGPEALRLREQARAPQ